MKRNTINDPKHQQTKTNLRIAGFILVGIGGMLTLVAIIDFFSAAGGFEPPKLFFLAFIGIPLLGIGGVCLKMGYMKEVASFVASQTAPVATDTFNYVVDNTSDSIAKAAGKIKDKLNNDKQEKPQRKICRHCGLDNDFDASFCRGCGKPLNRSCPNCGNEVNDTDKFCDSCGAKL